MNIVIVGATGVVGQALVSMALDHPKIGHVIVPARKPTSIKHPKLHWITDGFENPKALFERLFDEHKVDQVFCTLGTTIKTAGSEEAFEAVDYGLPLVLAEVARSNKVQEMHVVSALGADASSKVFYNRIKGRMERALTELNFHHLGIYRPSLIAGPRAEFRLGEAIAKALFKLIGWLIPAKYKGIYPQQIAHAMLIHGLENSPSKITILENKDMLKMS